MKKRLLGYMFLVVLGIIIGYVSFPLIYLLLTGDFPGSKIFYGLQEDSTIVTFLLNIR